LVAKQCLFARKQHLLVAKQCLFATKQDLFVAKQYVFPTKQHLFATNQYCFATKKVLFAADKSVVVADDSWIPDQVKSYEAGVAFANGDAPRAFVAENAIAVLTDSRLLFINRAFLLRHS